MVEKNNYRVVDIFKEEPSEKEPQDSLDDLINQYRDKAIKLVGLEAFNKRAEESRLRLLSGRDKKKSVGNARPLTERSVRIATAISIIREKDSQTAKTTPRKPVS